MSARNAQRPYPKRENVCGIGFRLASVQLLTNLNFDCVHRNLSDSLCSKVCLLGEKSAKRGESGKLRTSSLIQHYPYQITTFVSYRWLG